MKKNGFTLIELLSVILILSATIVIVIVKVDKNIKNANKFSDSQIESTIEDAAYIYAETYENELTSINTYNTQYITLDKLIQKGLLNENSIGNTSHSSKIVIAYINNEIKVKYTKNRMNAIFINGDEEISIPVGQTYNELGGYVALSGNGVYELTSENISSNVNTNVAGKYEVTYSYQNTQSVKRIVNVINN